MSKIHWDTATTVASRFAGDYPLAGTYHERRFVLDAPGYVARASDLVADETGLELPGEPDVQVVSRADWVDTNIRAFTELLAPLRDAIDEEASEAGSPGIAGRVMGAELGAVLGFLSKRVLGQYELVLPSGEDEVGDSVFFVGANVLSMERQHEFRPSHFRFWVALHECAHRAQFKGVPWMREYFLSLVDDLVGDGAKEQGRLNRIATDVRTAMENDEDPIGDAGILGLLASHDQRGVLDRVQALMSLLEGHGHVVMDRIGDREIVDVRRMSHVLTARRKDPKNAAMMRFIGMEMKMKQYELGAAFIRGVEHKASWESLDMAWESPEALPTLEEIQDPAAWLDRMAG
ncbi:MAG: zinc-dependent metalloprotease [Acidimicrobiia bacterium]